VAGNKAAPVWLTGEFARHLIEVIEAMLGEAPRVTAACNL